MKKLLIIHHGEGVGGGLIALLGVIEELRMQYVVEVFCIFDSSATEYIRNKGVKVHLPISLFYKRVYRPFLHSDASYFNIIDFLRSFKNIGTYFLSKYLFAKKELNSIKFDYDLVYLNSTFISDWAYAGKELNKYTIMHVREPLAKGVLDLKYHLIRDTIRRNCDRVIAVSKDNSDRLDLINKTVVIYDPVVTQGRGVEIKIEPDKKIKYFLYLGGTQRIKGFEQLVKSLPYINKNVSIFFLGDSSRQNSGKIKTMILFLLDPFQWKLNSLINSLNGSDRIINIGLVDNVFDFYEKSLALVSPFSKPHASLPILEAFSIGKPVIVSNVSGMEELVNERTGFFFKNNKPKDLARAINKLAELDLTEYIKMSANARKAYLSLRNHQSVLMVVQDLFTKSK